MVSTNDYQDPATIRRLLATRGRWAIVGLSANARRPAHGVSLMIRDHLGMEIIPVNLAGQGVHGEAGYRKLAEIDGDLDMVNCFVNSQNVGPVVDQAIDVGAKAVWLQVGVVDHEAAARARDAGLDVVMDTCPVIEAPKFGL